MEKAKQQRFEDIYPLTPLQKGMLFHTLYDAKSGVYFEQLTCDFVGGFDENAFAQSWKTLVARHSILRTAFVWKGQREPVQVVHKELEMPWQKEDWRRFDAETQKIKLGEFLKADLQKGFELNRAPLMRLATLRIAENRWKLVWSHHHLLLDGWSLPLLLKEFCILYQEFCQGRAANLPRTRSYGDYITWIQKQNSGKAEEFWKETFKGWNEPVSFGVDRSKAVEGEYLDAQDFLSEEETARLMRFGSSDGITLNTLVQGAWALILNRYSRNEDVVFGVTVSGRPPSLQGVESMVGLFINSLPFRVSVSHNEPVKPWLAALQEKQLGMQEFEYTALADIQRWGGANGKSLFESLLVFENYPVGEGLPPKIGGISIENVKLVEKTNYPLTLIVIPGDKLRLKITYDSGRFEEGVIQRMLGHLKATLKGLMSCERLGEVSIVTEEERRKLLSIDDGRRTTVKEKRVLTTWFSNQAKKTPDAVAVTFEEKQLTYKELDQRSNQLAHFLKKKKVGPEVLVGICVERSLEMLVGILGILKAGGAYVPMDPEYPAERLSHIIEDSGAVVVLTQNSLKDRFGKFGSECICLDDASIKKVIDQESAESFESGVASQNAAYVIYTSGSTGKPKGCVVTHENVVRLFTSTEAWYGFNDKDVWTLFHSCAFDFSVWEIWGALLYGGRVVVVPYLTSRSPEEFLKLLRRERVTVLNQTPSAFRQLIRQEEMEYAKNKPLNLRYIVFGGEALELQSLLPWFKMYGDSKPLLVNMYGITETTVHVTYRPICMADVRAGKGSVIGCAIPDLSLYVLDSHGQLAPIGVPGELCVGGAGVARGYLKRPELTESKFIPNSFSQGRLYRSGDLVKWLPDGDLEYLGRIDDQVKIRGFRIELGEIETVLAQYPDVREVVVVAKGTKLGEKRLMAYLVPRPGVSLKAVELRDFAKIRLPEYMVPSAFVFLENLPLTNHGKINRAALPEPSAAREDLGGSFVAPETDVEKTLVEIWSSALGIKRVGVEDNYFALGGDSIISIQILSMARQKGLEFSLKELFTLQTIKALGKVVRSGQSVSAPQEKKSFELIEEADRSKIPADVEDAYPLARLQAGMLFHSKFDETATAYHDISTHHLRAPLDLEKLRAALGKVIQRHPVLRTSFHLTGYSVPLQFVHRKVEVPLEVSDLSHLNPAAQEEAIELWLKEEVHRPFELEKALLGRFHLARRSEKEFQLSFSFHHAILDGWSLATLFTELFQHYLVLLGKQVTLTEAPRQLYRDYVALERKVIAAPEQQKFWVQYLNEAPRCVLPRLPHKLEESEVKMARFAVEPHGQEPVAPSVSAEPRRSSSPPSFVPTNFGETPRIVSPLEAHSSDLPKVVSLPSYDLQRRRVDISPELGARLKQWAESLHVPLRTVLLAAHLRVLSYITNQRRVVTGLVTNGRPDELESERILGLFLNTLPLHMELKGGSWAQWVMELFSMERELLAYRSYPLAEIQKAMGGTDLFETNFNFTHFHVYQGLLGLGEIEVVKSSGIEETNFAMAVDFSVDVRSGAIHATLTYKNSILSHQQISTIAHCYKNTLQAMVDRPNAAYEKEWLLPQEERQLLLQWNSTSASFEGEKLLHHFVEQQADRTPEAVALRFESKKMTYKELDARSNQLAHYLSKRGVGPDVVVGICMDRSLDLVVGLLGILKAGGAYLPLDPDYPPHRLIFMMEDSCMPVLLTERGLVSQKMAGSAKMVCLDTDWAEIAKESTVSPEIKLTPENLAYVIYTSGSTGKPKGVQIPHSAIVNHMHWMRGEFALKLGDRLLQKTPYSFDASVFEFWAPLMDGAELVLAKPGGQQDPAYLVEAIQKNKITVVQMVPTLLDVVMGMPGIQNCKTLRRIFAGGEALRFELQEKVFKQFPDVELVNLYGPTEAAIDTTFWRCRPGQDDEAMPIGCPIANAQVYVLDEALNPLPIGSEGELYVGGAGLARGYWNRPELTAQKFVSDPFKPGKRLYRTGDVARFLPDGVLEYCGRADDQVKVRGFRIELGEIEAFLSLHPNVLQAAVITYDISAEDKRLVAYIVARDGKEDQVSLRDWLSEELPDYMVPAFFIFMEKLPLNPSGKLDRKALPVPDLSEKAHHREYVAPETEVEKILAKIWSEVLCVEKIGAKDNFFELGGDSILSLQIVSRAMQMGWRISPKLIFDEQTLEGVAAKTTKATAKKTASAVKTLEVSLTPIQKAFFEQQKVDQHHFNQAVMLQVQPDFSFDHFKMALAQLIKHHDALQLRFVQEKKEWQQYLEKAAVLEPAVEHVDFSTLTAAEREVQLAKKVDQLQTSLDLTRGPILRAAYFDFGRGEPGRLFFVIHHLAVDGVSWRILLADLVHIYVGLRDGQYVHLPPKTTSFQNWAKTLEEFSSDKNLLLEADYWLKEERRQIAPLPLDEVEAFTDAHVSMATASTAVRLDAEETRVLLREIPAVYHTQVNDLLLTALLLAVTEWTEGESVLLDLEGHGREDFDGKVDLSRTVGWFTSLYPVLLTRPAGIDLGDLIKRVKEQLRSIPQHGLGYGVLRHLSKDAALHKKFVAMPKAEILFNYLGQFDQTLPPHSPFAFASESTGNSFSPRFARQYRLDVNAMVLENELRINWAYDPNLHRPATVEELAQAFLNHLRAIISHCLKAENGGYTPSDFPLARLDSTALDRLTAKRRDVEEIYPLSPLQEGILFQVIHEPEEGLYIQQLTAEIHGKLQKDIFEQAWLDLFKTHDSLRTAFHWVELNKPLQLVVTHSESPVVWLDWTSHSPSTQQVMWQDLLKRDQLQGFDLSKAPLFRIHMVRFDSKSWRLLLTNHHIVLDGWSMPLVINQLLSAYIARNQGQGVKIQKPRPYRDYIAWLEKQDRSKSEQYWRNTMAGFYEPTPLPIGKRTASTDSSSYNEIQLVLPESLSNSLIALAKAQHVTLNTVMQAMWGLLLARYSGKEDVLFGVTVSGRPGELDGVEKMVGLFINTLPLRLRTENGRELKEFFKDIQDQQSEISHYEYSRLVDVHGWSPIPRSVPLFETVFVFENYPMGESEGQEDFKELSATNFQAAGRTNFPLTCYVMPGRKIQLHLAYQTARFSSEDVNRILGHAQEILQAFTAKKSKKLGEIAMITSKEQEWLLDVGSPAAESYESQKTVCHLFVERSKLAPDAIAVSSGGKESTYRELERRSNQLAHYLRKQGVGPDVLVGICMERTVEMVVALLGILKAGGAYMPLDPAFPQERLRMMLEDSKAPLLLAQKSLLSYLPENHAKTICLDVEASKITLEPDHEIKLSMDPENLAYVIFTSGSTGRPKGVQISHRALTNFLQTWMKRPGITDKDVVIGVTTLSFDIAGLEIYLPLVSGARLALADRETAMDASLLTRCIQKENVSVMQATPATWRMLFAGEWQPPKSLRVWCGGEALPMDVAEKFISNGNDFWNVYGPTETTIWSLIQPVQQKEDVASIGRPIGNTSIYLLDPTFNLVPVGAIGELYIGGDGLARGYWNRSDLTADKFIPDPFSKVPGARLYRTGDQAQYRADGSIEFLGRADFQVKIRGYRIELGEIESVLREEFSVREAVVTVYDERPGEKRLVAYVIPNGEWNQENLKKVCRERLPDYMQPSLFMQIEEVPLTPNGKIDRRALPKPQVSKDASAFLAPRNEVETVLAEIWQEVLSVPKVGIRDEFLDLGGHSLLAAQVLARIQKIFRVSMTLRRLFEATTVEKLSEALVSMEPSPGQMKKIAETLIRVKKMTPEERSKLLKKKAVAPKKVDGV